MHAYGRAITGRIERRRTWVSVICPGDFQCHIALLDTESGIVYVEKLIRKISMDALVFLMRSIVVDFVPPCALTIEEDIVCRKRKKSHCARPNGLVPRIKTVSCTAAG